MEYTLPLKKKRNGKKNGIEIETLTGEEKEKNETGVGIVEAVDTTEMAIPRGAVSEVARGAASEAANEAARGAAEGVSQKVLGTDPKMHQLHHVLAGKRMTVAMEALDAPNGSLLRPLLLIETLIATIGGLLCVTVNGGIEKVPGL